MLGDFVNLGGGSGAATTITSHIDSRYKIVVGTEVSQKGFQIVAVAFVFSCHGLPHRRLITAPEIIQMTEAAVITAF